MSLNKEEVVSVEIEEKAGAPSKCPFKGDIADDCKDCAYSSDYHYNPDTDECENREVLEQPPCLADEVLEMVRVRREEYEKHFKPDGDPIMKKGRCMECGLVIRADTENDLLRKIGIHNNLAHKIELKVGGVTTSFVGKKYVPKEKPKVVRETSHRDEEVAEWV